MAIIKEINSNNTVNYITTVAFFCVISCTIIMLRFGGFKVTFNLLSKRKKSEFDSKKPPGKSISGAYRISQDEFRYDVNLPDPPKKITPAMVKLPPSNQALRASKSISDITKSQVQSTNMHYSSPNVSKEHETIPINNSVTKEQKKLEKSLKPKPRKQDQMAAREQQSQEKLRKEIEKKEYIKANPDRSKAVKKIEKPPRKAIQPANQPVIQQRLTKKQTKNYKKPMTNQQSSTSQLSLPSQQPSAQLQSQIPPTRYSTDTLESSISRSSGPPPYSATEDTSPDQSDTTGNISFTKSTEDIGSWDMISHHRQQIKRHQTVKDTSKQTRMDLQYNVGTSNASKVVEL